MPACPLCRSRKGKRACPAKGTSICAPCCGSKRRVEIACPEDCVYLTGGHAGSWEGRETERHRDLRRLGPFLQALGEDQARLFLVFLVGLNGIRAQRPELNDRLLGQAIATLRKTVETRRHGILYDHQADDARAQALVREIEGMFAARDESGRTVSPGDADLEAVLGAVAQGLERTARESAGPTAFLDTAARLAARLGAAPRTPPRGPLIVT